MKKNLLIALFATASMAGVAQAYNVVGSWDKNSTSTTITPSGSIAGNWSLEIQLNGTALTSMFNSEPDYFLGYAHSETNGKGLFSVSGKSYIKLGNADRGPANNGGTVKTTFVTGWGNSWYYGFTDNGVSRGFHIGVTDVDSTTNNYDMGRITDSGNYFDVYRFDTRDTSGKKANLDDFDGFGETDLTINSANLVVVHSLAGTDYKTCESETAIHLTLNYTVNGQSGSVLFVADIDDESNTKSSSGSVVGGSAYYDVDLLTSITGINKELVDNITVYDEAVKVENGQVVHPTTPDTPAAAVPEPTTATLSLLALAGLCARRRRH